MNIISVYETRITITMMGPDLNEINYSISRFIKNGNVEQMMNFQKGAENVLKQVYKHLDKDSVDSVNIKTCMSLLVNCLYLEIEIDIRIIPKLIELYKFHTHQSEIEKIFENLLTDKLYIHTLLENDEFLNTSLPIYLYRGLTRLLNDMHQKKSTPNDDVIYLLEFTHVYMNHHSYSNVTKQTFEDCLFILVNCAYKNFIQPDFIPMVRELFIHSNSPQMRYLCLTYLYNVYHDKLYCKYIGLFFIEFMRQFIEKDFDAYPKFCAILQDELKEHVPRQ